MQPDVFYSKLKGQKRSNLEVLTYELKMSAQPSSDPICSLFMSLVQTANADCPELT